MNDLEWRQETGALHSRVNEVKKDVAKLDKSVGIINTKVDYITKILENGHTMKAVNQRGFYMIVTALITSLFALAGAVIANL